MDDASFQLSAENYVPWCFDARVNPRFGPGNEMCRVFPRDPASGGIVGVMDIYKNMVGYEVSGVDVQFDWSFGAGPGTAGVKLLASGMDCFEATGVEGLPAVDDVGNIGGHADSFVTSSGTA